MTVLPCVDDTIHLKFNSFMYMFNLIITVHKNRTTLYTYFLWKIKNKCYKLKKKIKIINTYSRTARKIHSKRPFSSERWLKKTCEGAAVSSETVVRSSKTNQSALSLLHAPSKGHWSPLLTVCSQWCPSLPWHLTLSSLTEMLAPFAKPLFFCGVDVQN